MSPQNMRLSKVSVVLTSALALLCGACSSEASEAASAQEDLALAAPSLVGTFIHAPTSVAPPPGTVRSALLELEFTSEKDAEGRLAFHEKERSDDVHAPPLTRSGFYTATATGFTLHLSDELAYDYKYKLDADNLIFWSADGADRKQFLVRR